MVEVKKSLIVKKHLYHRPLRLERKELALLRHFAQTNQVDLLPTGLTSRKNTIGKCCNSDFRIVNYRHDTKSNLGKITFCCSQKLIKEIERVKVSLKRRTKTTKEIYLSSYKAIRGSIGHVIFQAFLGKNEAKYIRESKNIKENSLLRRIRQLTVSCSKYEWDRAINDFFLNPSKEGIERIIKLYSPLYRNDQIVVKKMAEEIITYLTKLPREWRKEEIRIVPTHVGMPDLIIKDKIIELKFVEKKLGWQKGHFKQLYRYYRSACRVNPLEKKRINSLVVFSPITGEIKEMKIVEAIKKWNLKDSFSEDFDLWQNDNYLNFLRVTNNVLNDKLKVSPKTKRILSNIDRRNKKNLIR